MRIKAHRYWFTLDNLPSHSPLLVGCGVSAYTYDDAISILKEKVFTKFPDAVITDAAVDVDITTLDSGVVLSNMGDVSIRGIWFPLGYS